jgi:hypothetical protein
MEIIKINFGDIVSELKSKDLVLCNRKTSVGLFLLDKQNNLYMIEDYYLGSYLDKLIKNKMVVEFKHVDADLRVNVGDWELEIWDCKWVENFIER